MLIFLGWAIGLGMGVPLGCLLMWHGMTKPPRIEVPRALWRRP